MMRPIKENEAKEMAAAVKERKEKLDAVYGNYSFEVPTSVEEIKEEGKRMFNALQCGIWNYSHYSGEKTLVFVRENGESAIDLLIEGGELVHAVRESNRPIISKDIAVISEWAKERNLAFSGDANKLCISC